METEQLISRKEDRSWMKKSAVAVIALLLVAAIVGALVVNKANAADVGAFDAESALADAVKPLIAGDNAAAPALDGEVEFDEPDSEEYMVAADEVPVDENEEVEIHADDGTMKEGKFEDEVADMDANDEEAAANFKEGKDVAADSRHRRCRRYKRCRYLRRCYRRRRPHKDGDDADDFYRYCRRYRRCSCPRGRRRLCRRVCRRYRRYRRVRVCRRRRHRRCYRRRIPAGDRNGDDRDDWRYVTRCRYYYRTHCHYVRRPYYVTRCRVTGCRIVCRCW